jgi:uncharacterized membrane protein SpoIIM required for sporulation
MVFESLISPLKAERKPWEMFFVGALYSSVAILLSLFVFKREDSSLVMIFLTVLACTHLMYGAIKMEERKEMEYTERKFLFKQHERSLMFFVFLFLGFVVSYSIWYIALPGEMSEALFATQIREIRQVQEVSTDITGHAIGDVMSFSEIFLNNMRVLVFCILFAFFYGVGAIFILTWNASIIGAAVGNFVLVTIGTKLHYLAALPLGLLRYSIHGIPEIFAYFMAGLAGGIISVAIIRHDLMSPKFKQIVRDSLDLVVASVLVLFVAALLEVYVTPLVF